MPGPLPEVYAITARLETGDWSAPVLQQSACIDWLKRFQRLLESGVQLIQLRAKELGPEQLEVLARHCQGLAATRGVRLLLNGPVELVRQLDMAGVHLTAKALMGLTERPLPAGFLVGASCHSSEELAQAEAIGADLACLSPVKPTKGYRPEDALGFDGFALWVAGCNIPVYGLGGLGREDLDEIRRAGGQGVAGISAFWS